MECQQGFHHCSNGCWEALLLVSTWDYMNIHFGPRVSVRFQPPIPPKDLKNSTISKLNWAIPTLSSHGSRIYIPQKKQNDFPRIRNTNKTFNTLSTWTFQSGMPIKLNPKGCWIDTVWHRMELHGWLVFMDPMGLASHGSYGALRLSFLPWSLLLAPEAMGLSQMEIPTLQPLISRLQNVSFQGVQLKKDESQKASIKIIYLPNIYPKFMVKFIGKSPP